MASCLSRGIQPSLARVQLSHRPEPHTVQAGGSQHGPRAGATKPTRLCGGKDRECGAASSVYPTQPHSPVPPNPFGSRCMAKLVRSSCPGRFTPAAARQASSSLVAARCRPAYPSMRSVTPRLCVTAGAAVHVAPPRSMPHDAGIAAFPHLFQARTSSNRCFLPLPAPYAP